MSGLRELLYRNCTTAFESWRERKREEEGEFLERRHLIRAMAPLLQKPDESEAGARNRVRVALDNYWPRTREGEPPPVLRHDWRADYLDAFAAVVEVPVSRLTHPSYAGGKVDEATYRHLFARSTARMLSQEQARALRGRLQRIGETPGMFELLGEIVEAVLAAKDPHEADRAIHALLLGSGPIFERKAPRRKKKEGRPESAKK